MPYILLIEDNQANANMTIRILESAGYTVEHSLRGFDGTRMARLIRPDIILLDLDLPDINGQQVALVLIKQLGGQNAPPIVAVTAKSGDAEMRVASRLGFSGFVSKPFRPEDLLAVIQKLLEKCAKPAPEKPPEKVPERQPEPQAETQQNLVSMKPLPEN